MEKEGGGGGGRSERRKEALCVKEAALGSRSGGPLCEKAQTPIIAPEFIYLHESRWNGTSRERETEKERICCWFSKSRRERGDAVREEVKRMHERGGPSGLFRHGYILWVLMGAKKAANFTSLDIAMDIARARAVTAIFNSWRHRVDASPREIIQSPL